MKRRIVKITDLADTIGCLFMPKLRYLWRFDCGHTELRTHCTVSGNGANTTGRYRYSGICKQCACPKEPCCAVTT